jgi:hypothetical protein
LTTTQTEAAQKAWVTMRAQALLAPEVRQLERTWRSWTRSAISCAKKRQAERAERGVAVTMTSDGLMAKLRAAGFCCALSGAKFRNDSGGRFGPTIPSVDRIDPDGPYSDDNTRVVCLGINSLRGRGSMDDMYRLASGLLEHWMAH